MGDGKILISSFDLSRMLVRGAGDEKLMDFERVIYWMDEWMKRGMNGWRAR